MICQRITAAFCVALAAFPAAISAQVMDENARKARLDEIAGVMEPAKGELAETLKDADDPFFTSRINVTGARVQGGAADAKDVDLSPEAILNKAADLLSPTGIMMGGTRRFIVSVHGDLYEVGKPLRVTLADGQHDIVVESADSESYVLKSGAITISRKYVDNSGGGKPAK